MILHSRSLLTLTAAIFPLLFAACGEKKDNDIDDRDDADDIVMDDADDTGSAEVRRYTKGGELPDDILNPNLLNRTRLADHLKPELKSEAVQFNIENRLAFDTKAFFPKLCLYQGVQLVKARELVYRYNTGVSKTCRPEGEDVTAYAEWEVGELNVPRNLEPERRETLGDYWFRVLAQVTEGKELSIRHRFNRSLLMDYREQGQTLRKSQLTTQSSKGDRGCRFTFGGPFSAQEFSSCVRQTGVRIWDKETGVNGISDFVRLYNPDKLESARLFNSQRWFDLGSAYRIDVNRWRGTITFDFDAAKDVAPLASLTGPDKSTLEFRPNSPD